MRITSEEAGELAMALLDPDGAPRVEAVRLVRMSAFAPLGDGTQWPRSSPSAQWWTWFDGRWPFDPSDAVNADAPIFVAVVSGEDIQLASLAVHGHLYGGEPLAPSTEVEDGGAVSRVWLVAVFDAYTGAEAAYGTLFESDPHQWVDALGELPPVLIDEPASARLRAAPTATATATRTPQAQPPSPTALPTSAPAATLQLPPLGAIAVADADLSSDVVDALDVFPVRPGRRWVFKLTDRFMFRWSTSAVTVTALDAWVTPAGVYLARMDTEAAWTHRRTYYERFEGPTAGNGTAFGEGETIVAYHANAFYVNDHRESRWRGHTLVRFEDHNEAELEPLPRVGWWPMLKLPLAPGGPWFLGKPYHSPPTEYSGFRVVASQHVVVPAGTFNDCWILQNQIGAGAGHWRWFCPGVGFVREESFGNNPTYWQSKLELTSWADSPQ